jgi:3-isopropylmalate/(R)-2-methylmalate dehydratase small subunit
MKITGPAWCFPRDNVDTGQIRDKRYAHLPLEQQAQHCLEALDAQFASSVKPGSVLVAGKNFGCGSSTAAHLALLALGISAVVAESFGRIFFYNAINAGLPAVRCPGAIGAVSTGHYIEIDISSGEIRNVTTAQVVAFPPMPSFLSEMIELGGEKAYLKQRLQSMPRA